MRTAIRRDFDFSTMSEPIAYLNGRLVPLSSVSVPIQDAGFLLGATVAEQMRTFAGRLFRLDQHLARLRRSLEIVGVDPGVSIDELVRAIEELTALNHAASAPGDDLNVVVFITPGILAASGSSSPAGPMVSITTRPLPFRNWADKYLAGERVVISSIQQVPKDCWPPELKCRSRMHYYLADREAQSREPGSRAILLHHDGTVSEATTANIVAYFANEGIVSPPHHRILPGVSVAAVADVCRANAIPFVERDLTPGELARADEIMLTSTSPCVLPVVALDGKAIGKGVPGPIFDRVVTAWGRDVGVDICDQARRFASR